MGIPGGFCIKIISARDFVSKNNEQNAATKSQIHFKNKERGRKK